jgi:hypothetical protein
MEQWSGNQIDPVSNLLSRKVFMQVGSADVTVGFNVMHQLANQLSKFTTPSDVTFVELAGAVHTFPTDFNGAGDNLCDLSESPFISNCGFDGAGAVLQWMYGDLNARNTGTLSGSVVSFAQTGSFGAAGMDSTGFLYVPAACEGGSTVCRLHVVMHGCAQSASLIGSTYIENTGYTFWAGKKPRSIADISNNGWRAEPCDCADTNNIILLFPQAIEDDTFHVIMDGQVLDNPFGCWDFVGWYGNNADQKGGKLIRLILRLNR